MCTCTMLTSLLCHAELLIPVALARVGGVHRLQDVKHHPQLLCLIQLNLPRPSEYDSSVFDFPPSGPQKI